MLQVFLQGHGTLFSPVRRIMVNIQPCSFMNPDLHPNRAVCSMQLHSAAKLTRIRILHAVPECLTLSVEVVQIFSLGTSLEMR